MLSGKITRTAFGNGAVAARPDLGRQDDAWRPALWPICEEHGIPAIHFDGDEVRDFFGASLGFGADSRLRVVSVLVHLANKAADAGLNVVVSALTAGRGCARPFRANVRNLTIGYVACSIQTCAQRDPKGLYRKAMSGEIDTLIGYNSEYRPPDSPDLVLDTEAHSVDELSARIVARMSDDDFVPRSC